MTISPRVAALLGASFLAFSGIFFRFSGTSPATATLFRCLYALPFLLVLAVLEERRQGPRATGDRLVCVAAGVFFAFDLVPWQYAVGFVGAGLATVITNLSVVVVGIVGWVILRERPTRGMFIGLGLVVVGAILISGVLDQGAYGSNPPLGVAVGLVAAVSYAGYLLLVRQANRGGGHPFGTLLDASASATVTATAFGLVVGDIDFMPSFPAHGWLFLVALTSQVAGYALVNVSLPRLPAVLTSIILLVQPVMTVAFSAVLLAEFPTYLQLAGVALVLAGVVVAAARGRATVSRR